MECLFSFKKKKKGALDFFVIINPCILWTSLNIKMSAVCKFPSHKNLEKVSVTMKMTKSPLFSYLNIVNCSTNWLKWTLLNWTDEKMKKKKSKKFSQFWLVPKVSATFSQKLLKFLAVGLHLIGDEAIGNREVSLLVETLLKFVPFYLPWLDLLSFTCSSSLFPLNTTLKNIILTSQTFFPFWALNIHKSTYL